MRQLLRFLTCGSVDDGKSTLIGRLLYDTKGIPADQLSDLQRDSQKFGTQGQSLDFALLVDGLSAEREQGITIDVAYRFFSTSRRSFIVADTPGHEQYTRNMATGASTAQAAVLLIDARKGVLPQTRRHSLIVRLLGIRSVALAVNKMDLIGWDQATFTQIVDRYRAFAAQFGIDDVTAIPVSALSGENIAAPSPATPWYEGPTLIEWLETVDPTEKCDEQPFRMAVQWVNRPHADFRGFAGLISSGRITPGCAIRVLPSGQKSQIQRIVTADGDRASAEAGQSVTVTLATDIDVSRGDLLCDPATPARVADQFEASILWTGDDPLQPGRAYLVKLGTRTVSGRLTPPRYRIDVNTGAKLAAATLTMNSIGVCDLHLDRAIAFDRYEDNRDTGGFIVIDRLSNDTVAAGFIRKGLDRSTSIAWEPFTVDKAERARRKGQRPAVLWFTGLPGAGKSTLANQVEQRLHAFGRHTYLIDGDNVRHGLNSDLGFSKADRVENIRRLAEVAHLMADAGLIVLVACVSPYISDREMARTIIGADDFLEIHVDAPLSVVEARDPKGLFAKARAGLISGVTGIDAPYEAPENPALRVDSAGESVETAACQVLSLLSANGAAD